MKQNKNQTKPIKYFKFNYVCSIIFIIIKHMYPSIQYTNKYNSYDKGFLVLWVLDLFIIVCFKSKIQYVSRGPAIIGNPNDHINLLLYSISQYLTKSQNNTNTPTHKQTKKKYTVFIYRWGGQSNRTTQNNNMQTKKIHILNIN